MAGIKIFDLPAVGRDLAATDLFEMSLAGGTGSRKITGQEIMNASKLSVGNTPIVNGAIGQILFQGTGNLLQESANLFWDATNNRLGIGTSTPDTSLSILFNSTVGGQGARIRNTNASGYSELVFDNNTTPDGTGAFVFGYGGTTAPGLGNTAYFYQRRNAPILFATQNIVRLSVGGTGNILIGTTTDAGFRLDVNGTARVQGLATIAGETQTGSGATGSLSLSQTWNTTGVVNLIDTNITDTASGGTSAIMRLRVNNTTAFSLSKIGAINFGNNAGASAIAPSTPTNGSQILNGQSITIYHTITTAEGYALWIRPNSGSRTATSGTAGMFRIGETFAPTSGTAVYNAQLITPTINQTGGANGITRGLFIDPILTAAANFRAIETTAGNVLFGTGFFWDNTNSGLVIGGGTLDTNYAIQVNSVKGIRINGTGAGFGYSLVRGAEIANYGNNGAASGFSSTTRIFFTTASSERLRIMETGNILINTTTDAGFRLDVNGTARVSGTALFQNSSFGSAIQINNQSGSTHSLTIYSNGAADTIFQSAANFTGNNFRMTAAGFAMETGGLPTLNASAILSLNSTTLGFLPPRMTQTQRNAIASPAIGLEIYQTDATEGKYIYKSSGWTYIG